VVRATERPVAGPLSREGLSAGGLLATLMALLLIASAFPSLRIDFADLKLHPYLVPLPVFAILVLPRVKLLPMRPTIALALFSLLYFLSTLREPGMGEEISKVGAWVLTLFVTALLIRNEQDFRSATVALNIAIAVLAFRALAMSDADVGLNGVNPLEHIANKNSFSLYALPAILCGGYVVLEQRTSRLTSIVLILCLLLTITAILSTANRSGWLGLLLIGVMLFGRGRRMRATLFLGLISIGVYYLLTQTTSTGTSVIEYRIEQTLEGYSSDTLREDLFTTALKIGLENPLLGVTPQKLPYLLAYRVHFYADVVDPHNLFGLIAGGSGLIALAVFLYFIWSLIRRPRAVAPPPSGQTPGRKAHGLLRMMVLLFVMRGMFSREIIYTPGFSMGLGFALGLCLIEGTWRRRWT
jgi:O-antigen ligase